ncbi:hypothetical protein, partial [Burkholderia orbicola]|uniref:hypothetical protein n=1 Tax=Burkholderia orbicola TaxID=2978683 RepID=UPI0039A44909
MYRFDESTPGFTDTNLDEYDGVLMPHCNVRVFGRPQPLRTMTMGTSIDIMRIINLKGCSSFLEMSCSSHLEMSHLDLGKLAGSPSDHGADDAPNSSGDI